MLTKTALFGLCLLIVLGLSSLAVKPLQAGNSSQEEVILPSGQTLAAKAKEIGLVKWRRNLDLALETSEKSGKPVLVLFQEVPGCHGCKKFGEEVLTNQLIVDAAENEFLPVLVYNNRGGKDAELLKSFGEPSWNYQVMRFLNSSGEDIIPRKDKVWTTKATATRMASVLEMQGKEVPPYLESLAINYEDPSIGQAVFFQHCFWTGEMRLGGVPGVLRTEAGFYEGREVTRVWYQKSKLKLEDLVAAGERAKVADKWIAPEKNNFNQKKYRVAPKSDQKRQIRKTVLAEMNLNDYQATKANAFLKVSPNRVREFLSPGQIRLANQSGRVKL